MERRHEHWRRIGCERGSNVAQAAALAVVALALIGALFNAAPAVSAAVQRSFGCLAAVLGGGSGACDSVTAVLGGSGTAPPAGNAAAQQARAPLEPCPTLPNAGYHNLAQPGDTAALYRNIRVMYQQPGETMDQQRGPIGITSIGDNRYLVTLVGIEYQSWGEKFNYLPNAVKDELGFESQYHAHVRDIIAAQIPPGAEIVFAAHSHGGIVSQNLARDPAITGAYNVTHVVTYGSPVSGPPMDNTQYRMFAINGLWQQDVVPLAGITHLPSLIRMTRNGQYHDIPAANRYWNPFSFNHHSEYAEALEALRDDPQYGQLLPLPFRIDRWGPTRTFHANNAAAAELRAHCR